MRRRRTRLRAGVTAADVTSIGAEAIQPNSAWLNANAGSVDVARDASTR